MEQFLLQHPYLGLVYLSVVCLTTIITAAVLAQKDSEPDA